MVMLPTRNEAEFHPLWNPCLDHGSEHFQNRSRTHCFLKCPIPNLDVNEGIKEQGEVSAFISLSLSEAAGVCEATF